MVIIPSNDVVMRMEELCKDHTSNLKTAAKNKKLSLCIGAGVSRAYVGDWSELLNSIATMRCYDRLVKLYPNKNYKQEDVQTYISKLKKNSFFPMEIDVLEKGEYWMYDAGDDSRYIDSTFESQWRELYFAQQVRLAIQQLIDKKLAGEDLIQYYLKNEQIDKSTLEAVVALCILCDVSDIIVYNFDDIVDQLLLDKRIWDFYKKDQRPIRIYNHQSCNPLYSTTDKIAGEPVNVYHVHGYLGNECTDLSTIVFSEDSYLRFQNSPHNLGNTRMLDVMLKSDLLCVGFSGTDSNFRLLCRTICESRKRVHDQTNPNGIYITRQYKDVYDHYFEKAKGSKRKRDIATACFDTYVTAVDTYFSHLYNIDIMWYENFTHMAKGIRSIGV